MTSSFFLHYDPENKRSECVKMSNITDNNNVAIELTNEQATKILVDNISILQWAVGKDVNNNWAIFDKHEKFKHATVKDNLSIIEVKEDGIDNPDVILSITKDSASISLLDSFKFIITKKDDPRYLLGYLDFEGNVPSINTTEDYRDCSFFIAKQNQTFTLEILHDDN